MRHLLVAWLMCEVGWPLFWRRLPTVARKAKSSAGPAHLLGTRRFSSSGSGGIGAVSGGIGVLSAIGILLGPPIILTVTWWLKRRS